jgi:hypothetical protein
VSVGIKMWLRGMFVEYIVKKRKFTYTTSSRDEERVIKKVISVSNSGELSRIM